MATFLVVVRAGRSSSRWSLDFGTAANVMSQLHTDAGEATVYSAGSPRRCVPNAAIFSGSYLLGPGFPVGAGTLVSPALVSHRPAADVPAARGAARRRADAGLDAVPARPAAAASPPSRAARAQRRNPTLRWEEGALRGCAGGVAGRGAARGARRASPAARSGPGRMRDVGPLAFDVLVHAITAFGIGGLIGGAG